MSLPNMKPYDPNHKGEFCTRDGRKVCILATDMVGGYPIQGYIVERPGKMAWSWTHTGQTHPNTWLGSDIMCVTLHDGAQILEFDGNGNLKTTVLKYKLANATFREVMPDDISQEKAHAVIEAARKFVFGELRSTGAVTAAINELRNALADDV